jgi:acetyltransferase-like isoleucine patch superfamily enzyme
MLYLLCGQGGRLRIGAHVFFNTNCSVSCMGETRIGEYCKIGNNVVIVDHDHNYKDQNSEFLIGSIVIGNRVWIGANCTILQGAQIGDDCIIAAGSIVRGVVPAGSVYCQKRQTTVTARQGRLV